MPSFRNTQNDYFGGQSNLPPQPTNPTEQFLGQLSQGGSSNNLNQQHPQNSRSYHDQRAIFITGNDPYRSQFPDAVSIRQR